MGPPTLRYQRQLVEDPLSPVLDGALSGNVEILEVSAAINAPVGLPILCHK